MPILASRGALNNKSFGYAGFTPTPTPPRVPGYLYTVGDNTYGQLGLGTTGGTVTTPTQVGSSTDWFDGDYGYGQFGIMIKNNGSIYGCGLNAQYQLGLGNTTNYNTFQQIGSDTNWKTVSCGFSGSLAIKTNGTMWGWGISNYFGTTGPKSYQTPTQPNTDTNWADVDYYNYLAIALKTDGTLWTAGDNRGGSCGRGLGTTSGTYYAWGQVGSATNWTKIYTVKNGAQNFAINSSGELYGAGYINLTGGVTNNFTLISTPEPIIDISGGLLSTAPTYDSYVIVGASGKSYSLGYASVINPGYWTGLKTSWFYNGLNMTEAQQGAEATVYRNLTNTLISSGNPSYTINVQNIAQNWGYEYGIAPQGWFIIAP